MEALFNKFSGASPPTTGGPAGIPDLDNFTSDSIRIVSDLDLNVSLIDVTTRSLLKVTGRADWAFGYGTREDLASYVVGVMAKTPDLFSGSYLQLLTCLGKANQAAPPQQPKSKLI